MKRYLAKVLSRRSAVPLGERECSVAELQWLTAMTNAVFRKPVALPAQAPLPFEEVLRTLSEQGLRTESISLATWLDDAHTAPNTPVLFVGPERMGVLLGRQGDVAALAEVGDPQPRQVPLAELRETLASGTRYWVLRPDEEDSPEAYGWRWFVSAFFSRKAVLRDALIVSMVIQLMGLAFPLATQVIVDKVIVNQATSTLIAMGVGIALFAVFNAVMSWLRQKVLLRLANVVDAELSQRVMEHLFRLPLRFFESRPTGVLITRIHGVERVREFASGVFLLLALEMPFMLVFLALMLSYSVALSGVVLGFVTFMLGLSLACGPRLRRLANAQFEAGAKVQGFLTERVAANETVKSLQLEPAVTGQFSTLNRKQLGAALALREFGSGYGTFMQLAEQLMNASVLCLGAWLAMTTGQLTIGMLVAFQMFAQRVSQPLLKLSGAWQELQQVRTAVAQLGDVMSLPTERYGSAPTSAGSARGKLEVQGLSFRHAPDRPPLYSNLSFAIEPGEIVLVTGASGSGKSTLAKILLGFYQGYEGCVRIDGRDIRSMPVNELRKLFGVVPQETVLFAGTVLDNVTAGLPATLAQAVQACHLAGIHETIENLPNGYLTEIGERGVGLSGGQRQRIGIARALLKRPAVLIFDEATSGLDAGSAERIGEMASSLRGKATVLFVAHKVPASLRADRQVQL